MSRRDIYYKLHSGKNSNLKYYVRSYLRELMPRWLYTRQLEGLLRQVEQRPDLLQQADQRCRHGLAGVAGAGRQREEPAHD